PLYGFSLSLHDALPILAGLSELFRFQIKGKTSMKNIFVGNLSFGSTEQDIRLLFETYGKVDRVNIVTDRETGQPRGFGFVEMGEDRKSTRLNSSHGSIS